MHIEQKNIEVELRLRISKQQCFKILSGGIVNTMGSGFTDNDYVEIKLQEEAK